ncbi:15080_t:CDS:2, partial [Funneliformis geosporum]
GPSEGVFIREASIAKVAIRRKQFSFPFASNISVEKYNSFIESEEISEYKLNYKKVTVYIVEMCSTEYDTVIDIIGKYFNVLCPSMYSNAPIKVCEQP